MLQAIGVVSGVVWTALCNSWQSGKLIIAEKHYSIDHGGDRYTVQIIINHIHCTV